MKKYYKKMNRPAPDGLLKIVGQLEVFRGSQRLAEELYKESLSLIKQEGIHPSLFICKISLDYIRKNKFFSLNYYKIPFNQGIQAFIIDFEDKKGKGIGSYYFRGVPVGEIDKFEIPGETIKEKFMEKDLLERIGKEPFQDMEAVF